MSTEREVETLILSNDVFQMSTIIPALEFCLKASGGADNENWKSSAAEFKTAYYKV